jgi:hypothetical protein
MDAAPTGYSALLRRHTIDVRAARADTSSPIGPVTFTPSQRVSQYIYGSRPGSNVVEQLQINPPDLPMFALGTIPFIGDYIDVNAPQLYPLPTDGPSIRLHQVRQCSMPRGQITAMCAHRSVLRQIGQNTRLPASTLGPSLFDPTQKRGALH